MVEIELQKAIEASGSESGQVIVMDPRNGEILAMAAWPSWIPTCTSPAAGRRRGTGDHPRWPHEPGSPLRCSPWRPR
jgi:cell division protein FtsI/penicillin-binding protein 2